MFNFWEKLLLHQWYTVTRVPVSSYPYQHLLFLTFLIISILKGVRLCLIIILIFISMMVSDIEQFFMCLSIFLLGKCVFRSSIYFSIVSFICFMLSWDVLYWSVCFHYVFCILTHTRHIICNFLLLFSTLHFCFVCFIIFWVDLLMKFCSVS